MARILTIGDPHFKKRGASRYDKMSDEIILQAKRENPDAIVILGDTLHTHENAHQLPYNMACKMIKELSKISPTILLIGNHDYSRNTEYLSENHFFNPLKEWDNVIVVDKPVDVKIGRYIFAFCPYVYPGLFMKALFTYFDNTTLTGCKAVFGHQEIRDVQMGPIKSKIGDIWEDTLPLLITGHIHEFNMLKNNVVYVGTPIQHNFGDGTDKGIYLFEFTDDNYSMKKLEINVPLKRIYRLSVDKLRELSIPENIEAKIIVTDTPERYHMAEKEGLISHFRNYGCVVIHEDTTLSQQMYSISISKPFLHILYDKIKHDDCLIDVYTDIFGSKKSDTIKNKRIVILRKK